LAGKHTTPLMFSSFIYFAYKRSLIVDPMPSRTNLTNITTPTSGYSRFREALHFKSPTNQRRQWRQWRRRRSLACSLEYTKPWFFLIYALHSRLGATRGLIIVIRTPPVNSLYQNPEVSASICRVGLSDGNQSDVFEKEPDSPSKPADSQASIDSRSEYANTWTHPR